MKHIVGGTVVAAALIIAVPAWAQTMHHHVTHHRGHHHVTHHMSRAGTGPSDNVANRLNAQEAASHLAPGMMGAGSHGGPYGQPTPTQRIPGASQPSASSHPPNQFGQH
jgi:hypothetical protein